MGERPVPVPGVDVLFTDEDAVEILDYIADEHLICSGCGQPRVESFAAENEWMYKATPMACHACATKARATKKLDVLDGVYTFVEKKA
jgi:hypothetical protein